MSAGFQSLLKNAEQRQQQLEAEFEKKAKWEAQMTEHKRKETELTKKAIEEYERNKIALLKQSMDFDLPKPEELVRLVTSKASNSTASSRAGVQLSTLGTSLFDLFIFSFYSHVFLCLDNGIGTRKSYYTKQEVKSLFTCDSLNSYFS
jgi:hypothetical protein